MDLSHKVAVEDPFLENLGERLAGKFQSRTQRPNSTLVRGGSGGSRLCVPLFSIYHILKTKYTKQNLAYAFQGV